MENNIKPKFLRAKGIAKHFNIGESTVWYYLKIGKIKSKKISERVTLFDVDEVEQALCSNQTIII
jgi:predicted DNA-binding transcriptional regulator AlpA